jgi:ubiquinone/menaquinone biosynthesis C-methylase UbiE
MTAKYNGKFDNYWKTTGKLWCDQNIVKENPTGSRMTRRTKMIDNIMNTVKDTLNTSHPLKVLEVGCNYAQNLKILKDKFPNIQVYGIDISEEAIDKAQNIIPDGNFTTTSLFRLSRTFRPDFFDIVFTSGVLIHIAPQDIKKAITEIQTVAKYYISHTEIMTDEYYDRVKHSLTNKVTSKQLKMKRTPYIFKHDYKSYYDPNEYTIVHESLTLDKLVQIIAERKNPGTSVSARPADISV